MNEKDEDLAILERLSSKKPVDVDIAKHIREKAEKIMEQTYQKHGLVDVAVPAIRELRD